MIEKNLTCLTMASTLLLENKSIEIQVFGSSMYPFLFHGDFVEIAPLKLDSLKNGDIIFIKSKNQYLIHRYYHDKKRTKGDNCQTFDEPMEQIYGRIVKKRITLKSLISRMKHFIRIRYHRFQLKKLIRDLYIKLQELYYDYHYQITTSHNELSKHPNNDYSSYQPIPWHMMRAILKNFNISSSDILLDVGCGKGRSTYIALQHSFNKVIALELENNLYKQAIKNVRLFQKNRIEIYNTDALFYEIPEDVNYIFMYTPFTGVTLERFISKLENLPQEIILIFVGNSLNLNPFLWKRINISPKSYNKYCHVFGKKRVN